MRALPIAAFVTALVAAPMGRPAHALVPTSEHDPQAAAQAQAEAGRRFDAGDYRGAAEALERAYALDPQLTYLFQRGQALRLDGDCEAALPVFEEVERLATLTETRAAVAGWIEYCRERLEEAAPEDPVAEPAPPEPEPTDAPVEDVPPPRRDLVAGITLGIGTAATLTGVGLLVGSAVTAQRRSGEDELAYEDRVVRSRRLEVAGGVVLAVGLATVVGAIVRYVVVRRRSNRVAVVPRGLAVRF